MLGEYVYNALGQRVIKTADGRTSIYMYDQQGNLVAEADGKGNIINEYIWLKGRLLAGVKSGKELVEATLDIDPDTLNLDSHGNWITAFIKLPFGYDVAEIDPATITLNQSVFADRVQVGDFDSNGIPDLMVKFDRALVSNILEPGDAVEILVEGEAEAFLMNGVDTIRVISTGKKNKNGQDTAAAAQTVASLSTASNSSRVVFYHLDHLGTPQVMTDENGEVVWQADFFPFGEVDITANDAGNEFRFPGQYYDQETGLHYNYHRYYDPKTGRYLTPDQIGLYGGINLYNYANDNPLNAYDPDGRAVFIATGIIGGASGAFSGFITGLQSGNIKAAIAGGIIGGFAGAIVGTFNPFGSSAIGVLAGNISAGFVGGAVGGYASAAIDPDPCADKLKSATKGSIIGAMSGAIAAPITYFGSVGVAGSGYAPWINASAVSVASESVALPTSFIGSHLLP